VTATHFAVFRLERLVSVAIVEPSRASRSRPGSATLI
jgi:hypothetical protein